MKRFTFLFFGVFVFSLTTTSAQNYAYGINPYDNHLATFDIDNLEVISEVEITTPGETVNSGNGLAWHPTNGKLYTILKIAGESTRFLATIIPSTGVATLIGDTGEKLAGITFGSDGTLYAVSGDGGNCQECLFTLDINNASLTFKRNLGAGSDGEVICFNPDDGLIYHGSGRNTNNAWESIDPVTNNKTSIPITGFDWDELFGLLYIGNNTFLASNLDLELIEIKTDGSSTRLGSVTSAMDVETMYFRGFVFTTPPFVIPTLSQWGILALGMLTLIFGVVMIRERKTILT